MYNIDQGYNIIKTRKMRTTNPTIRLIESLVWRKDSRDARTDLLELLTVWSNTTNGPRRFHLLNLVDQAKVQAVLFRLETLFFSEVL